MDSRLSNLSVKPGQKNPIDSNTIRSSSLRDYTPSPLSDHFSLMLSYRRQDMNGELVGVRFINRGHETLAAAMTQSVAITCAQIATIPKNNASEASVATSSTTARPMSLTPFE
jgi:hypothetical protein